MFYYIFLFSKIFVDRCYLLFLSFLFSVFLLFSFGSFASCINITENDLEFLPSGGTCDRSSNGALIMYDNSNVASVDSDNKNDLSSLISGKNDGGYSMHFTFDRDNIDLVGEQIFFAAYDTMSGDNVVARAGIKGGQFFYETGTEEINSIDMSALGDPDVINPHIAIIVYDDIRKKMTLNIDGAEVTTKNVGPITAKAIKRIEFGKNYIGKMGIMSSYATKLSIQERMELVKILGIAAPSVKVIKPKIGSSGVMGSGFDSSILTKCVAGKVMINKECRNAIVSGFVAPSNSIYNGGSDIEYNSAHNGQANAKLLDCSAGYQVGDTPPKYWFTLNGDLPSVHIDGTCVEKTYILGQDGNDSLPANAIDPGILTGSSLANYTSSNPKPLKCDPRHEKSADFGIYVDSNDILRSQGSCTYNGANANCYTATVGTIGKSDWDGCAGMLVVSQGMLNSAKADNSFDFKPTDSYTSHDNDITYSFGFDFNNIFTGQVANMRSMFNGNSSFNGDISYWDTSSVTNMAWMFSYNSGFNQDLSNWDTSSVTDMGHMFRDNHAFNGDISSWDTSNVTNMSWMFTNSVFNGDLSSWDTSSVTTMGGMFSSNSAFNGDLSGWNTGNVTDMAHMFYSSAFNNNSISNWDTGSVTEMYGMFTYNSAFNGDLSGWDTSSVRNVRYMFKGTSAFNGDLSSWCVQQVGIKNYSEFSTLPAANLPPFGTSTNCN